MQRTFQQLRHFTSRAIEAALSGDAPILAECREKLWACRDDLLAGFVIPDQCHAAARNLEGALDEVVRSSPHAETRALYLQTLQTLQTIWFTEMLLSITAHRTRARSTNSVIFALAPAETDELDLANILASCNRDFPDCPVDGSSVLPVPLDIPVDELPIPVEPSRSNPRKRKRDTLGLSNPPTSAGQPKQQKTGKATRTTHPTKLSDLVAAGFLRENEPLMPFSVDVSGDRRGYVKLRTANDPSSVAIRDGDSGREYTSPSAWLTDVKLDLKKKSTSSYSGWENIRVLRGDWILLKHVRAQYLTATTHTPTDAVTAHANNVN